VAPQRTRARTLQRRDVGAVAAAAFGATFGANAANAGALTTATTLVSELKTLKADVRSGKMDAPAVRAAVSKTLEPLRNGMAANPQNTDAAKIQPLLLKGHMLELDAALGQPDGFATYVSKSTKETYPGGKVERELEEAVETAGDYCGAMDCDLLLIYR